MQKPSFDPGLTQQADGTLRRAINKDGSFDVERRGGTWRDIHPYLHLINMGWAAFLGTVLTAYIVVNSIFALIYFSLGPGEILGVDSTARLGRFLSAFFFSAQTLTTVGYGNLAPGGTAANALAIFEAMVGLMGFALATGLLFGRVSKPSAKIGFSEKMLVARYPPGTPGIDGRFLDDHNPPRELGDHTSLQFRVVNRRSNVLIELEASVMLMTVEGPPGERARKFRTLTLERERIYFFPLTWTVVHPIDESSPLYRKTPAELKELQAEVLILIKGFDDTFSQSVNARYSYRYDEMEWGARFVPAFHIDPAGQIVLEVDKVGEFVGGESVPGA